MSNFTKNQKKSIEEVLSVKFSKKALLSDWNPHLAYSYFGHHVQVTEDRTVLFNDESIPGEWKGRKVGQDISDAISNQITLMMDQNPDIPSEEGFLKEKVEAKIEQAKKAVKKSIPPAPPTSAPDIRKKLFVEKKPMSMPRVERG